MDTPVLDQAGWLQLKAAAKLAKKSIFRNGRAGQDYYTVVIKWGPGQRDQVEAFERDLAAYGQPAGQPFTPSRTGVHAHGVGRRWRLPRGR